MAKISQTWIGKKSLAAPPVNNHDLSKLGFDHSSIAGIIYSVSSGSILMVNKAALKLLGYTKKELLFTNRNRLLDITETRLKKLAALQVSRHETAITLTALKKGNRSFSCRVNYAVFKDEAGKATAVINLADMSRDIINQSNIDTEKEKIVSKNIVLARSRQKNIDTRNKKIVAHNIVVAKAKQQQIDTTRDKEISRDIELVKSKQKSIDLKNEKLVNRNIRLAKAKAEGEKRRYENIGRKKILAAIEENLKHMFNSSSDALFDADLLAGKLSINKTYQNELGYLQEENMTVADNWMIHIHADDMERVMQEYHRVLKSTSFEWKLGYRFLKPDGSVASIISSCIILRMPGGMPYRMIGSMHDISKQKVLEENIEREIMLKDKQITEAAQDAKEKERSDIGKELHDNVNQLLGASRLYLELARQGGKDSEMYLSRSSQYTLTAIEEIRKLSKGLTSDIIRNLGLCGAIENITHDTMQMNAVKIVFKVKHSIESRVNDKFKLALYRIIQEQLNNILKHAKATRVFIQVLQDKKQIRLMIADNGIGFDTGKKRKGIGVANIKSRAASYNGTAEFISQPGGGCVLTATFSASDKLLERA